MALFAAVICAAGSSSRMGGVKKEYLPVSPARRGKDGRPLTVLGASVETFAAFSAIAAICVAIPGAGSLEAEENACRAALPAEGAGRVILVRGGPDRRTSVLNALRALKALNPDYVLIHDGARPWATGGLLRRVMDAVVEKKAVIPVMPAVETPKEIPQGGLIVTRHLKRRDIAFAQTPQAFAYPRILECHEKAAEHSAGIAAGNAEYTDDAEVWAEFAGPVAAIEGEAENRKITFMEDVSVTKDYRIGIGKDLHRLVPGRRLLLGGVEIPSDKGEDGHSDGDALAHAVTDALLGAAGAAEIGELFPDTDPRFKDADSLALLAAVGGKLREDGWHLANLDCVVSLEKPKVLPWRERIRCSLASALGVGPELVFVKAKTGEGLGAVGRGEAVEAEAVCLLKKW
jgi:2-C-methyl-D-erythritol 4-phosphate cytidylyltransferase/2-C-methyl-D-erythritol 2,4-cyclodiphosphate synthase